VARANVPVPHGRPYDLGEPESAASSPSPAQPSAQGAVAARFPQGNQPDFALAPRTLDAQASALPATTSAFAPMRYDSQSGRGLY
jgi:hypothetical protein